MRAIESGSHPLLFKREILRSKWRNWDLRWTRRFVISMSTVMVFCLLTVFVGQHIFNYQPEKLQLPQFYETEKNVKTWLDSDIPIAILNRTAEVMNILEDQRRKIRKQLKGKILIGNETIKDYSQFIPENGGNPIRIILASTWRSGSTFLGELLHSLPASYYHYEPLLDYDIIQIRGPPLADRALQVLKNLFHCNYAPLNRYLKYGPKHPWLMNHNIRLWSQCTKVSGLCWSSDFLIPFCKLFPFQTMKVVRLRLSLYEELLTDLELNIKLFYLVRDPRGTLQSRKHRPWCPGNEDCDNPILLCSDLISDFSAARRLRQQYPDRFRVIRYEDMSNDPYNRTKVLFQFLGFEVHPDVKHFLDTHTRNDYGDHRWNTYRDTKSTPYHWQRDLTFEEVDAIQNVCGEAMKLWGYVAANDQNHLLNFDPLSPEFEFSSDIQLV